MDQSPLIATLTKFGVIGVRAIQQDVDKVSATDKTKESVRFQIIKEDNGDLILRFLGRAYFSTLETGRGPRKSNTYGEFDLSMLEYIKARGIGADLDEKGRERLARFLTLKINREGDSVFKKGGRIVYSPTLAKLVTEIKLAITQDFKKLLIRQIINIK